MFEDIFTYMLAFLVVIIFASTELVILELVTPES